MWVGFGNKDEDVDVDVDAVDAQRWKMESRFNRTRSEIEREGLAVEMGWVWEEREGIGELE